jgi:hypothetical protein
MTVRCADFAMLPYPTVVLRRRRKCRNGIMNGIIGIIGIIGAVRVGHEFGGIVMLVKVAEFL